MKSWKCMFVAFNLHLTTISQFTIAKFVLIHKLMIFIDFSMCKSKCLLFSASARDEISMWKESSGTSYSTDRKRSSSSIMVKIAIYLDKSEWFSEFLFQRKTLVEEALSHMDIKVAEHAMVKMHDYYGLQFLRRLQQLSVSFPREKKIIFSLKQNEFFLSCQGWSLQTSWSCRFSPTWRRSWKDLCWHGSKVRGTSWFPLFFTWID